MEKKFLVTCAVNLVETFKKNPYVRFYPHSIGYEKDFDIISKSLNLNEFTVFLVCLYEHTQVVLGWRSDVYMRLFWDGIMKKASVEQAILIQDLFLDYDVMAKKYSNLV